MKKVQRSALKFRAEPRAVSARLFMPGAGAVARATASLASRRALLVTVAAAFAMSAPGVAAADESEGGAGTTYYISLGDSLASGYQPDVDKDADAAYTDVLFAELKQREPGLKHLRLGCFGETTESLIKGGTCDYPNARSQLEAALQAMAKYRGKVSYVTVSVGAADIDKCVTAKGSVDGACMNSAGQTVGANLAQITGALRKAGTAGTHYAGATYYNPVLAAWLLGDAGQQAAKDSAPLMKAGNAAISQVYGAADFKVADVATAFSSDEFDTSVELPGHGEVPANVAKVCQLTWACTTAHDPHPNAEGHKAIAGVFAGALPQSDGGANPGDPGEPTPSASATPPGNASASAGAEDGHGTDTNQPTAQSGDLAETGASNSTPVIAGIALTAMAAGAATLFVVRRRRTAGRG